MAFTAVRFRRSPRKPTLNLGPMRVTPDNSSGGLQEPLGTHWCGLSSRMMGWESFGRHRILRLLWGFQGVGSNRVSEVINSDPLRYLKWSQCTYGHLRSPSPAYPPLLSPSLCIFIYSGRYPPSLVPPMLLWVSSFVLQCSCIWPVDLQSGDYFLLCMKPALERLTPHLSF